MDTGDFVRELMADAAKLPGPASAGPGRRLRIYRFSPEALIGLCRGPIGRVFSIERDPMPADARVQGVGFDDLRGNILLRVESEAFEEVPAGQVIPAATEPWFKVREINPV